MANKEALSVAWTRLIDRMGLCVLTVEKVDTRGMRTEPVRNVKKHQKLTLRGDSLASAIDTVKIVLDVYTQSLPFSAFLASSASSFSAVLAAA